MFQEIAALSFKCLNDLDVNSEGVMTCQWRYSTLAPSINIWSSSFWTTGQSFESGVLRVSKLLNINKSFINLEIEFCVSISIGFNASGSCFKQAYIKCAWHDFVESIN